MPKLLDLLCHLDLENEKKTLLFGRYIKCMYTGLGESGTRQLFTFNSFNFFVVIFQPLAVKVVSRD